MFITVCRYLPKIWHVYRQDMWEPENTSFKNADSWKFNVNQTFSSSFFFLSMLFADQCFDGEY